MRWEFNILKALIFTFLFIICMNATGYTMEETIKVGFVGDFSDVSQVYTRNMYKAVQLAVDPFVKQQIADFSV